MQAIHSNFPTGAQQNQKRIESQLTKFLRIAKVIPIPSRRNISLVIHHGSPLGHSELIHRTPTQQAPAAVVNRHPRRMHHPNQPRRAAGIIAMHDVAVRVGEGGGGFVGDAGEERCHRLVFNKGSCAVVCVAQVATKAADGGLWFHAFLSCNVINLSHPVCSRRVDASMTWTVGGETKEKLCR